MTLARVTRRRHATVVAALLPIALLSGCSPEFKGVMGISRGSDGHLLAVLATCGVDFDLVVVSLELESTSREAGRWTVARPGGSQLVLDLEAASADGVTRTPAEVAFEETAEYTVSANAHNEFRSEGVDFVPKDVRKLKVGEVLYAVRGPNDSAATAKVSQADFADKVCRAK